MGTLKLSVRVHDTTTPDAYFDAYTVVHVFDEARFTHFAPATTNTDAHNIDQCDNDRLIVSTCAREHVLCDSPSTTSSSTSSSIAEVKHRMDERQVARATCSLSVRDRMCWLVAYEWSTSEEQAVAVVSGNQSEAETRVSDNISDLVCLERQNDQQQQQHSWSWQAPSVVRLYIILSCIVAYTIFYLNKWACAKSEKKKK